MYEYKVVEVPIQSSIKSKKGDSFNYCVDVIHEYASKGWRLVQIVIPPNEKMGVMMAYDYKIIFEKQTTTE